MKHLIFIFAMVLSSSCGEGEGEDITDTISSAQGDRCTDYVGTYTSSIQDSSNGQTFNGRVEITDNGDTCTFSSNSIPNHDVNDSGGFATPVAEVEETFEIPVNPTAATSTTALTLRYDNAVFLNGVKLDLLPAACYGVGGGPLGEEKIGCFEDGQPWRYDPMFANNDFDTDSHNAHTQPDGAYHYHGDPVAMYDTSGETASGVIGFAADGFPIFGPYIDDGGTIRKVESGYALKSGARTNQNGEGAFPGGNYDGTYIDDYEWQSGQGDLDACNGMERDGQYGYYVTHAFPWVMRCFTGTPHSSFKK